MTSSAVLKAIAGSKLAFIEKYGFAYEEDIAIIQDMLGAKISYSPDGKRVRIELGDRIAEAVIRQAAARGPGQKGGWVEC